MTRPKSRQERRAARDLYIKKRTKIFLEIERSWGSPEIEHREPYEHETRYVEKYNKYQEWLRLSEEDKIVRKVEAFLDGKVFEEPKWEPFTYGKFAKYNLVCGCHICKWKGRYDRIAPKGNRSQVVKLDVEYSAGLAQ